MKIDDLTIGINRRGDPMTFPMTEDAVAGLKSAAEKATPGFWKIGMETANNDAGENAAFCITTSLPYKDTGITCLVCCVESRDLDRAAVPDLPDGRCDANYIVASQPSTILALLAEREADKARVAALEAEAGDTTWFWDIVDKGGLTNLPSDEESALHRLVERAAARAADKAALEEMRKALFMCAAHCQGGHIMAGEVAAKALGIGFPVSMDALEKAAVRDGLEPRTLWPWLFRMRATRSNVNTVEVEADRVLAKTAAPPQTQEARDA